MFCPHLKEEGARVSALHGRYCSHGYLRFTMQLEERFL